jgi:hypothetical protein
MKLNSLILLIVGVFISISIYQGFTYEKSTFMDSCKSEWRERLGNKYNIQEVDWQCEQSYLNNGKDY